MRHAIAAVAVIVAANVFGQLVACAALQDALFGPAPVANPADDAQLWACRTKAQAMLATEHDARAACHAYDSCVIDAGMRGDIGYCAPLDDAGAKDADHD